MAPSPSRDTPGYMADPVGDLQPRADDPALRALGIAYFQTAADLFKSGRYN